MDHHCVPTVSTRRLDPIPMPSVLRRVDRTQGLAERRRSTLALSALDLAATTSKFHQPGFDTWFCAKKTYTRERETNTSAKPRIYSLSCPSPLRKTVYPNVRQLAQQQTILQALIIPGGVGMGQTRAAKPVTLRSIVAPFPRFSCGLCPFVAYGRVAWMAVQ